MRLLSVVVPFYNEQGNVRALYEQVRAVAQREQLEIEMVFVDDGSTDETWEVLESICRLDDRVIAVRLRRNFGQTAAMREGFRVASGDRIVTLDGDLQNDPADIPRLLEALEQGADLAVGWRRNRQDSYWVRTLPSKIANWLISRLSGVRLHDIGCSLKAYRSEVIKPLPLYSDMHRFIPMLCTMLGATTAEVAVNHRPRQHGKSKYGLSRVGRVVLDAIAIKMLVTCATSPMRWFSALALPFGLMTVIGIGLAGYLWYTQWPATSLVVYSLAFLLTLYLSLHLVVIGILAELIVKSRFTGAEIVKRTLR